MMKTGQQSHSKHADGSINKSARGKLTIFLGAAAGTGKTYMMLDKARELRRAGVDVVVGCVETRERSEIQRLLTGMRKIPEKILKYQETSILELDIDSIILRNPMMVLVDELAHANAPGSRHVRRFQDVEDLLEAGINVYTTLNIGQIESLHDIVAKITNVIVRETVPDHIIEQADSIQIVDCSLEELADRNKEDMYRQDTFNALRGVLFRFAANRVDQELDKYIRERQIISSRPTAGMVMVCVDANPFSMQLIRAARRLATGVQSGWLAVHIETNHFCNSEEECDLVAQNMRLAEELGAKTIIQSGENLIDEIVDVALNHNVTAIVVGKPQKSLLREFFHKTIVDQLLKKSHGLDIYVVNGNEKQPIITRAAARASIQSMNWLQFGGCILLMAAVTGLGWLLKDSLEVVNIALLYQLPVMLSAFWWGRWPSYFTAVCSVLIFNYIFVPPVFAIRVYDRFVWSSVTFLIVSYVIGRRTELLRDEAETARQRERSTHALFDFSRAIAAVIDLDTIIGEFTRQATKTLQRRITLFMPDDKGQLSDWSQDAKNDNLAAADASSHAVPDSEVSAALWSYEHRQVAGRSTDTLPSAENLYLPLITRDTAVGVLGIRIAEKRITPEQRRLMETWAGLAAIAIERVKLSEKAREAALLLESDRLRSALINSVSHELRTPLSLIIGSSSTLLEAEATYTAEERRELLENIKHGANRMERVVANLLDTARLESGMMRLKIDWCDIEDIIGTALRRMVDQIKDRPLVIKAAAEMPLLRGDCVLLEQVMINLLDNALKYSPAHSAIEIDISASQDTLQVSVADQGAGIPEEDLPHIFDKFYRAQQSKDNVSGTGLGLSICKSILEAHGGTVFANNRSRGGARIGFRLLLNDATLIPSFVKGGVNDD